MPLLSLVRNDFKDDIAFNTIDEDAPTPLFLVNSALFFNYSELGGKSISELTFATTCEEAFNAHYISTFQTKMKKLLRGYRDVNNIMKKTCKEFTHNYCAYTKGYFIDDVTHAKEELIRVSKTFQHSPISKWASSKGYNLVFASEIIHVTVKHEFNPEEDSRIIHIAQFMVLVTKKFSIPLTIYVYEMERHDTEFKGSSWRVTNAPSDGRAKNWIYRPLD